MKTETLHDCPRCGTKNFTANGLKQHDCKKHAERNGKALAIIEPKTLAVIPDAVPLHNVYHRNAMFSTAQAACWIVMAGAELRRCKKTMKHGGWEKWVETHCEFSDRTAQKYMQLAEHVKDKALRDSSKANAGSFLELLEKPAATLTEGEQLTLLKAVHGLTDGATVSELYEDFGIVKRMKDRGGKRTKGGDTEELTAAEKTALFLAAFREDFTGTFLALDALLLGGKWRAETITDGERDDAAACAQKFADAVKAFHATPKSKRVPLSLAEEITAEE
jgi:hypothetical protein